MKLQKYLILLLKTICHVEIKIFPLLLWEATPNASVVHLNLGTFPARQQNHNTALAPNTQNILKLNGRSWFQSILYVTKYLFRDQDYLRGT